MKSPIRRFLIGHLKRSLEALVGMATAIEKDYLTSQKERDSQIQQVNNQGHQVNPRTKHEHNSGHKRRRNGRKENNPTSTQS